MMDSYLLEELKRRRANVLEKLRAPGAQSAAAASTTASEKGDVLVLFSNPVHRRNSDVEHPYRQHSDFYYLTGFEEPDAALVLWGAGGAAEDEPGSALFLRPRNREKETWEGRRLGLEQAPEALAIDEAVSIEELEERLPDFLEDRSRVHFLIGEEPTWDRLIIDAVGAVRRRRRKRVRCPTHLVDAREILHEMRLIKSDFEQRALAEVGDLSANAHRAAMAACRPRMTEWQLQDVVESSFRRQGARRVAYESIVGSGENATILHYRENEREMLDGDLVLIDAGAEKGYLASDITRTFPVNGKFSPTQRSIYELVLRSQLAAMEKCVAGQTMDDVHEAAVAVVRAGLSQLGLLDDALSDEESKKRVARFFMHRTSHFLGMDVHDVGRYHEGGKARAMEPGMVITVEPGLYFASDDDTVPERYRGIGVRIEDDVLITTGAPRVLTDAAPKTPEAVEEACSRSIDDI